MLDLRFLLDRFLQIGRVYWMHTSDEREIERESEHLSVATHGRHPICRHGGHTHRRHPVGPTHAWRRRQRQGQKLGVHVLDINYISVRLPLRIKTQYNRRRNWSLPAGRPCPSPPAPWPSPLSRPPSCP